SDFRMCLDHGSRSRAAGTLRAGSDDDVAVSETGANSRPDLHRANRGDQRFGNLAEPRASGPFCDGFVNRSGFPSHSTILIGCSNSSTTPFAHPRTSPPTPPTPSHS